MPATDLDPRVNVLFRHVLISLARREPVTPMMPDHDQGSNHEQSPDRFLSITSPKSSIRIVITHSR